MAVNVEKFKKRILDEKARLEGDRNRLNDQDGDSLMERSGDLVDFDMNHPADSGTELFEREKDIALSGNLDGMLGTINRALAKIEEGTYGVCDRCGKPIPEARLEAIPYAIYTVDCQAIVEGA